MTGHQPAVADQIAAVLQRHQVEVIFGQSVPSAVLLAVEGRDPASDVPAREHGAIRRPAPDLITIRQRLFAGWMGALTNS